VNTSFVIFLNLLHLEFVYLLRYFLNDIVLCTEDIDTDFFVGLFLYEALLFLNLYLLDRFISTLFSLRGCLLFSVVLLFPIIIVIVCCSTLIRMTELISPGVVFFV
jgi:hypothetical protein